MNFSHFMILLVMVFFITSPILLGLYFAVKKNFFLSICTLSLSISVIFFILGVGGGGILNDIDRGDTPPVTVAEYAEYESSLSLIEKGLCVSLSILMLTTLLKIGHRMYHRYASR